MAKKTNWGKIRDDYLIYKDEMTLKEFSEKHGVKYSTLRSRKNREDWDNIATDDATKKKSVATKKSKPKKKRKIEYKKEIEKLEDADLTDKQRLFCIEYVKCFNATKAYQKAYKSSYSVANSEGYKLLVNPCLKAEIQRLKQAKLNRAMLSEDDIFQKYIDIAFADITDYVSFGNIELPVISKKTNKPMLDENKEVITSNISYVDLKDSKGIDGTIISEVSKGKDGARLKLQDKMKALQWLSDRMDLLPIETQSKVEKTKAQVEKIKGIGSDIEDTSGLRRLLLDE